MPHTYYTSGAILHSTQEVEVALTILKLTGTGGQAGRQAGTSKYRDACASKNVYIFENLTPDCDLHKSELMMIKNISGGGCPPTSIHT